MWPLRKQEKECESAVAIVEAQKHLRRIKARTPEVLQVTAASRNLLERNHFAEQLGGIMGG